jgi:hypothetical protein
VAAYKSRAWSFNLRTGRVLVARRQRGQDQFFTSPEITLMTQISQFFSGVLTLSLDGPTHYFVKTS